MVSKLEQKIPLIDQFVRNKVIGIEPDCTIYTLFGLTYTIKLLERLIRKEERKKKKNDRRIFYFLLSKNTSNQCPPTQQVHQANARG